MRWVFNTGGGINYFWVYFANRKNEHFVFFGAGRVKKKVMFFIPSKKILI